MSDKPVQAVAAQALESFTITIDKDGAAKILINGNTPENLRSVWFNWSAPTSYLPGGELSFEYETIEKPVAGQMSQRNVFRYCPPQMPRCCASIMPVDPATLPMKVHQLTSEEAQNLYSKM